MLVASPYRSLVTITLEVLWQSHQVSWPETIIAISQMGTWRLQGERSWVMTSLQVV